MDEPPGDKDLDQTERVMAELLRQPPKSHDEMKLGRPRNKKATSPKRKVRKSQAK